MPQTVSLDFLYHYATKVVRVYDGDTVFLDIDLGLHTWIKEEKIRLARIDTPELRGADRPLGEKARDFLANLILDKEILLTTLKDRKGKYGRYLGELWLKTDSGYENVNDKMVTEGYAKYVDY